MTPTPFCLIEIIYVMANPASLDVGTVVSMREHQNDEILSCMWRGALVCEDSECHRVPVSPGGLTMINTGKSFVAFVVVRSAPASTGGTISRR